MEKVGLLLSKQDFDNFRSWISLDLDAITWQGRYTSDFEEFWNLFFVDGLSFQQVMDRFEYASAKVSIGPLASWFTWLKEKFIIYVFINKNVSLIELCREGSLDASQTANVLREFFSTQFPYLEDPLNEVFQVGNILSENIYLNFEVLKSNLLKSDNISGRIDYEVMPSMEITLYDEWRDFLSSVKKDLYHPNFNFSQIKTDASLKRQFRFFKEVVILLIIGVILIFAVKQGNELYEKYLAARISIYEPQFRWLDKTIKFKSGSEKNGEENRPVKINFDQIKVSEIDREVERSLEASSTFVTESEVSLTSWGALPKDFDATELEQSEYEEQRKGGYRDTRFGNRKVYRVMINSVDAIQSRKELNSLLQSYGVKQVDKVKPGLIIPGGVYYNLYVPRQHLKEFLSQVMEVDDSILYESRTRRRNPPGMNKVFIWVKLL